VSDCHCATTAAAVAGVSDQFQKEKDEIIACHKKAKDKYEIDISSAMSKSQEEKERAEKRNSEYDELQKEMRRIQALHREEIELVKCEATEQARMMIQRK
jgi:hypothetical protein